MKLFPLALSLTSASVLLCANVLHAQNIQPCGTDEIRQRMIQENPDLLHQEAQYELGLQEYLQAKAGLRDGDDSTEYVIPMVFHILYDPTTGTDVHNISDAQIYEAVNIVNRDYAKMNADIADVCCGFSAIAANTNLRFQLATKDPFGVCTNGIDRITTQRSTEGGNYSKLNPWFRQHYLNIWVVNSLASDGGFHPAGFSQLPADVQDASGSLRDGVILLHNYTGDDGTSNVFSSRTLTHEIGHFLNLKHTWGGTNAPEISCGDDGVDDTPITKGHLSCDLYDSFCSWTPVGAVFTFDDVTVDTGTTDPTPVPTVALNDSMSGLTLSPFTAAGLSGHSWVDSTFSFSQWGNGATPGDSAVLTGQLDLARYYEFTVTPEEGSSMSLNGLTFQVARSATGPRSFAVRTSKNGFSTNMRAVVPPADTAAIMSMPANVFFFRRDSTGNSYTVSVDTVTYGSMYNSPISLTYRIYAWNAVDDAGLFTVDSVSVNGKFGKIENVQNYMEYSYCTRMFTDGQKDRMRATLNSDVSSRSSLWQDANHQNAGIDGYEQTCGPQADFYTLDHFVCQGTSVRFKDNSKRATPTSWAWTFDGGNPATSTDENPIVSFDQPGEHAVTLTVGNDFGSSSITKNSSLLVGANYSEVDGLLQESFNTNNDFQRWPVLNIESNNSFWHYDAQVGHDGPGSAKLNASNTYTLIQDSFTPNNFHDKDILATPMLDLRFIQDLNVRFWYAYSTQTGSPSQITESLKVFVSTSCGKNWNPVLTISGADLVTAGVQSPGYVPMENEWRQKNFTLPGLYANNNVRLKFEYSSGLYSNDLYIDDVNITGSNPVGIDELAQSGGMALMPNPASNSLTVDLDLAGATAGTLTFLDMTGRTVYSQAVNANEEQLHFDLGRMGITSGVYLVRLKHTNGQRVERLVVR